MSKLPTSVKITDMANLMSDSAYESLWNTLVEELQHKYGANVTSANIAVTVEAFDITWE